LILILAGLIIFGSALYFVHYCSNPAEAGILEVRYTNANKVLGKWQLDEDGEFAIEFIHSVNQSLVRETYRLEARRIKPQSVRLYSFGAGMSDLGEGQKLSQDGDAFIISGFSSSFKELNLIIGSATDHVLFINNEIISLRELSGKSDGRNAHITIQYR